jgi:two-component system NtrC family response regulator
MLESETDRRAEGNEPEDGNAGQNFLQTEARSKPLSTLREFKSEMERVYLERLILETGGEVKKMLEMSGLSRSHFYAVLKKNDITL